MRRTCAWYFLIGAVLVLSTPTAEGQCGHHGCYCGDCADGHHNGCGHHAMGEGCCQSGSVTGIHAKQKSQEGKITEINYLPGLTPEGATVQIRLLAGPEALLVRLAPIGFLRENDMELKEGDTLGLTGYWASTIDGQQFIATRITKQSKSLSLRDPQGNPLW